MEHEPHRTGDQQQLTCEDRQVTLRDVPVEQTNRAHRLRSGSPGVRAGVGPDGQIDVVQHQAGDAFPLDPFECMFESRPRRHARTDDNEDAVSHPGEDMGIGQRDGW